MPTPASVTTKIARFVNNLKWEDLPIAVQDRARDRFIDAVSTGIAGRDIDVSQVVRKATSGTGGGPCSSFVDNETRQAGDAALVNGTALHSILYEDINAKSSDHPGPVMVPACLAVAEEMAAAGRPATIKDLLTGIVVGYEVQLALGRVMARSVVDRGLRTTSLFGCVAAAAAAAKVYRLNEAQTMGALNMGANFAFGILEGIALTGHEMYVHAGMAGRTGIMAARMGEAAVVSTPLTFEGPLGYFNAFGPCIEEFTIGDDWRIMNIWCKPYPLSGGKIRGVDAGVAAWQAGVRPENIKNVKVRMSPRTIAYPGADWRGPFTRFTQAQNSTQFCISAALLGRDMAAVDTFTKGFGDTEVASFMQKVDLVGEPERIATGAEQLDIEMNDGTVRSFEVEWADSRVATVEKMVKKLRLLSRDFWPADNVDKLAAAITGPVDRPIGDVTAILRRR